MTRKRRSEYSLNGEFKRCRGPLHAEGVMLPIVRFSSQGGGKNGTLTAWCRECRAVSYGRDPENVLVPMKFAQPVQDFLVDWLGSKRELSRRTGIHYTYFSDTREHMQGKKFVTLLKLSKEVAQELGLRYYTYGSEPHVVPCNELLPHLKKWEEDFLKAQGYEKGVHEQIQVGTRALLHEKTGINLRQLTRIFKCEMDFVGETKADKLLTAIDKAELLDLGEITVMPNPQWTPAAYIGYLREQGVL
jgi:hypothetical protein